VLLFFGATQVNVSKVDGLVWVSCVPVLSGQVGKVWAKFQGAFIWYLSIGFFAVLSLWFWFLVVLGVV
jgi:hypothetical protein